MKMFLTLCILMAWIGSAQAGFYLEPYVGYGMGDGENKTGTTVTEEEFSGALYGARIGGSYLMLNFGLDYSKRMEFDLESTTGTTTTTTKYEGTYMGLFLGVDFPVLVRGWVTYFIDATTEVSEGNAIGDEVSGGGLAVGLGFTGLPFISLNAEYRMLEQDEYKDVSAGTTTAQTDHKINEIILSVSIPLDI